MDLPSELLDQPSLEIGEIKQHCEWLLEEFESEIEYWFAKRHTLMLEVIFFNRLLTKFPDWY